MIDYKENLEKIREDYERIIKEEKMKRIKAELELKNYKCPICGHRKD